jgi:hypothetical protein
MKKKPFLALLLATSLNIPTKTFAQESPGQSPDSVAKQLHDLRKDVNSLSRLKVTGWIQAQFQYIETRGAANFDGGQFAPNSDKRFMIRRGRVKFTYNGKNTQYVMQINGTERGLNLTEIFAVATDPWSKSVSLTVGLMNRPFGFEIDQSSAVRESPERSRYTQILMPNERDLGGKITFAPGKGSALHGLRLDAGFYNGQGAYVPGTTTPAGFPAGTTPVLGVNEFDFQKDFIGRLSFYKDVNDDKVRFGIGLSHYNGGNIYQTNEVYRKISTDSLGHKVWIREDTTGKKFAGKTSPRVYYGGEAFISVKTALGNTTVRGEYITGTQSGYAGSSASPFFLPAAQQTYERMFDGMYVYLIHRVGKHEAALKYEWYDPNTAITSADILSGGKTGFSSADIKYTQTGITYTYYMYENVKFMFNYNMVTNETVSAASPLTALTKEIKDNILTVRMQYRF